MKQDILQTLKITAIALALTLGVNYVFAWTGPTSPAPDGNTSTPINIGTVNQVKNAGLGINALSVFGNSFFQGTLGLGDSTPDTGLKLDVEGNVGATEYCDQNGENCTTATDLFSLVDSGGGAGGSLWTLNGVNIYNSNSGAVGIGDSTPDTGLKLDVEGKVGATQYCDQNGANCATLTSVNLVEDTYSAWLSGMDGYSCTVFQNDTCDDNMFTIYTCPTTVTKTCRDFKNLCEYRDVSCKAIKVMMIQ